MKPFPANILGQMDPDFWGMVNGAVVERELSVHEDAWWANDDNPSWESPSVTIHHRKVEPENTVQTAIVLRVSECIDRVYLVTGKITEIISYP